jgi:hypothetical protein
VPQQLRCGAIGIVVLVGIHAAEPLQAVNHVGRQDRGERHPTLGAQRGEAGARQLLRTMADGERRRLGVAAVRIERPAVQRECAWRRRCHVDDLQLRAGDRMPEACGDGFPHGGIIHVCLHVDLPRRAACQPVAACGLQVGEVCACRGDAHDARGEGVIVGGLFHAQVSWRIQCRGMGRAVHAGCRDVARMERACIAMAA